MDKDKVLSEILLKDKILLLSNAIDSIHDSVCITDTNEKIIFVNASFMKTYGYTREELLGQSIMKLRADHYQAETVKKIVPAILTGGWEGEVWNRRKDGKEFLIWLSASVIYDDKNQPIAYMSIAHDITKHKLAEDELKKALSLLSATIESTADGILVVDLQGKIVTFNRKYLEMWRIPESILALRDAEKIFSFEKEQLKDPQSFINKVNELNSQPDAESYDVLEFKDGRIFERISKPQKVSGVSIGRVWTFHDVTQFKKIEEALKQAHQKLKKN